MPSRQWDEGNVPHVCVRCGSNQHKHRSRGLCTPCFLHERNNLDAWPPLKAGRPFARKDGTGDMVDDSTEPETLGDSVSPVAVDDPVGGGGVGEDTQPLTVPGSRERRPGGDLPSPPADAPTRPKKLFARLLGRKNDDGSAPRPAPHTREKSPKDRGRRISGAETISDVWAGVGNLAARNPNHVPLGRYMTFQAPVAGEMLDEAVAKTVVDKLVVQPVVRARGKFDLVGAVFGPPALIYAIERQPDRAAMLIPLLRSSIRNALPLMVPAIKRVQQKEAKMTEAADDLFDSDPAYQDWVIEQRAQGNDRPDPSDYILGMIFNGWAPPVEPEPQPSEATA